MEIFGKTVGLLLILSLLGALGAGLYFGFQYVAALFGGMDPQVAVVTAVGASVILLAALIVARGTRAASRQNKADLFLENKAEVYQLFIDFWVNLILQRGVSTQKGPAHLPEALQTLECRLVLYGSPALIKIHTDLRALGREGGTQGANMQSLFGKGLAQIRKELGSETEPLAAGQIEQLLFSYLDNLNMHAESKNPKRGASLGPNTDALAS